MRGRRFVTAALVTAVIVVLVGVTGATGAGAATSTQLAPGAVDRILIVSTPGVGWSSINEATTPNLWHLFESSAVGNLTARTLGRPDITSGYVTFGAGTRAIAPQTPVDGAGMEPDEPFGTVTARDAFRLDTGRDVTSGILQLGIEPIVAANDAQRVEVTVGALGDTLRRAGLARAVIANGDGHAPDQPGDLRRDAVNALMGGDGVVPAGRVASSLLEAHESAPFGLRYDNGAVVDAFGAVWGPRAVVLVEGSDLVRADTFASTATSEQASRQLHRSLRRTDELVGSLLAQVDLRHDAVVVVSPTRARSGVLTAVAVHAPGVPAGLLTSASTRRPGFVLLSDVAPTLVSLLGLPRDHDMSGSRFSAGAAKPLPARVRKLTNETSAAVFRDHVRASATYLFAIALALVLGVAAYVFTTGRGRRARAALAVGALAALAYLPAVYLARLVPFYEHGNGAYWTFLVVVSLALALVALGVARNNADDAALLMLAFVVGVIVVDVLTGARLQLSSAFGYSAAVGIRVAGLGNVAYAVLGSCAVLLAGYLTHRIGGRRGALVAIAVMGVALVVDIAPFWGSDVGGVLSLVPAFGVAALGLLGVRVRFTWRATAIAAGVTAVVLAALTALDLSRPADARTHLGRLAQQIADRGVTPFADTVVRKVDANLQTWSTTEWRVALAVSVVFGVYVIWFEGSRLRAVVGAVPEMRPAFTGLGVLAVAGYVFNDSGAVIPAIVASIGALVLVLLVVQHGGESATAPPSRRRTQRAPSTSPVTRAVSSHE
ncbi:MAG: hypothetical protein ACHQIG_10265 [Acidimicrobiia bacterium]